MTIPQYEINRRRNRPNYGENDGNLFSDFLNLLKKKEKPEDPRSEIEKITGKTVLTLLPLVQDLVKICKHSRTVFQHL